MLELVRSILSKTTYSRYEIVIAENGDFDVELQAKLDSLGVRQVHYNAAVFNMSDKMNLVVEASEGEYVVLLNDDMTQSMQRQFDAAIKDLTTAIELGAADAISYYERGTAYYWRHEPQSAIADYTQSITLTPTWQAYVGRGNCEFELKQLPAAIEDCTKALQLDPKSVRARQLRAECWITSEQFAEALTDKIIGAFKS